MASIITADTGAVSGSAGLKQSADSSGILALATGTGTTAVTIDASQNVGIGTGSPSYKLDVVSSSDATLSSIQSTATANSTALRFGISGNDSFINATGNTTAALAIKVYGTERMRIDSSGNVAIGDTSNGGNRLYINGANANTTGTSQFRINNTNGQSRLSLSVNQTNNTVNFIAGGSFVNPAFTWINNDASLEHMRLNADGNLGVGGDPSSNKLLVQDANNRTISTAQVQIIGSGYSILQWLDGTAAYIGQNSAGRELRMFSGGTPTTGVKLTAGATSWASTSDEREKDIIEPIADATQKLSGLRTVIGKYKTDDDSVRRSFLIAQDVESAFPEAVSEDQDGMLSLRYTDLIPVLVKAIQEQQALITTLTERITALEGAQA